MKTTRDKNCYCHECSRDLHYLGTSRHRKWHLERGEQCTITFTSGETIRYTPKRSSLEAKLDAHGGNS